MKLKCFLALILSCSDMAGATFKGMFSALESGDLEKFKEEMARTPVSYTEYLGYLRCLPIDAEFAGINREELLFLTKHFALLGKIFVKVAEEDKRSEEVKENRLKMLTAFSKRVLEEPFRKECKLLALAMVIRTSQAFYRFRRDPELNQLIKDNASGLYLRAITHGFPGVLSTLKGQYGALLPADNEKYRASCYFKLPNTLFTEMETVASSFLPLFAYRGPREPKIEILKMEDELGSPLRQYTKKDLDGLCDEFVLLYEDFIKGKGRRSRSLEDEMQVKKLLRFFLQIPLTRLTFLAEGENIESEDFLRMKFDVLSPDKSEVQKKSVAERFGGFSLPIIMEYLGYPEEPHLYTIPLQQMAISLKETDFHLFKRCSEESLEQLKFKVAFLKNNLVLENDENLEEEVLKEKYDLCRKVFLYPDCKLGKSRARIIVQTFLRSRQKYPEFFARNLDALEKFYNNLSRDLQEGPGSNIEEERKWWYGKTSRMEEE